MTRKINILGIESSCDDTSVAIIQNGTKILSNVVYSQDNIHEKYGGIVPELAARKHITTIIPTIDAALKKAKLKLEDLSGIAVTSGPGLITSLLIGVDTAKTLAYGTKLPLLEVNHLEGHFYSLFFDPEYYSEKKLSSSEFQINPEGNKNLFPMLCLLVSGGHTDLFLLKNHLNYTWIGGTRDDAAGEAFDKVAKLLHLGYPGGPEVSKKADFGNSRTYQLPRPMIDSNNFDFSFSGLKTEVLRLVSKKKHDLSDQEVNNLAASFQAAVSDVLTQKTIKAAKKYKVKSISISGGVSANKHLRQTLTTSIKKELANTIFLAPSPALSTDNAVGTAAVGYLKYLKKDFANPLKLTADSNLKLNQSL